MFMQYPPLNRVGRANLGDTQFSDFRRILEKLHVEWWNSTPRFASISERGN